MKVVTEEHYIPEKRYTTKKYIASDGVGFMTEKDCFLHEERIKIMSHPVFKSRIVGVYTFPDMRPASLYYISSLNDHNFLVEHSGLSNSNLYTNYQLYGSGWYLYYYIEEDSYYSSGRHFILNYDMYEKECEKKFKEWKTKMHKEMHTLIDTELPL